MTDGSLVSDTRGVGGPRRGLLGTFRRVPGGPERSPRDPGAPSGDGEHGGLPETPEEPDIRGTPEARDVGDDRRREEGGGVPPDEEWFDEDAGPVVRPYAVTGGRTRPTNRTLELVALVSTTPRGRVAATGLEPEQRAIAIICQQLQSIFEIAAQLEMPLGVVRVLVSDMLDVGLVSVHRPARPTGRPDSALMEKVLDGLQTL
jgi:hypothetical protein